LHPVAKAKTRIDWNTVHNAPKKDALNQLIEYCTMGGKYAVAVVFVYHATHFD
jgi:DNA gyrase inhibitor GyrI